MVLGVLVGDDLSTAVSGGSRVVVNRPPRSVSRSRLTRPPSPVVRAERIHTCWRGRRGVGGPEGPDASKRRYGVWRSWARADGTATAAAAAHRKRLTARRRPPGRAARRRHARAGDRPTGTVGSGSSCARGAPAVISRRSLSLNVRIPGLLRFRRAGRLETRGDPRAGTRTPGRTAFRSKCSSRAGESDPTGRPWEPASIRPGDSVARAPAGRARHVGRHPAPFATMRWDRSAPVGTGRAAIDPGAGGGRRPVHDRRLPQREGTAGNSHLRRPPHFKAGGRGPLSPDGRPRHAPIGPRRV